MRLNKVSYLCIVNLNILIMVQDKKLLSSKPRFVEVEIGDYLDLLVIPLDNNDTESLIRNMVKGRKFYSLCVGKHKDNVRR